MSFKLKAATAFLPCALLVGCGTESAPVTSKATNYEVADDSADAATPQVDQTTSDLTTNQVAPRRPEPMNQAVPVGANSADAVQPTPAQLLEIIRGLREQQPKGSNQEEMIADFMDLQTQLVQATDMLIGLKPDDAVVTEAAEAKINALTAVSRLGAKGALDQLAAFTKELENHPSEEVSKFGRQQSFLTLLNAFSTDQVTDSQQVIDAYKKLADEQPKEGGLLTFGRDVASRLMEKGKNNEAAEVLRYTAGLVKPTDDPQLRAATDSLLEQAKFAEVDLGTKLSAVAENKEGAIEEFTKTLGELTSGEKVGVTTLQTVMQIASMLEPQHGDAASQVYDILEASFGKSSDVEVAEVIKETIDKYRLRSSIVGKPFVLEGQLLDGTPFDWSQYHGKVVLVDFWATWCGPCLREMPNIRANFEKYQSQGFEVVGVNLDDDVQELKEFSSLQPLPWPSVLSSDSESVGWEHPMVKRYGVAAIPFLVLVDRAGTAIALNTRGPALGEKLAELFPDSSVPNDAPAAAVPDKAASPTEKPATSEAKSKSEVPAASEADESATQPESAPAE